MLSIQDSTILIIPCFNEEARLKLHLFENLSPNIHFLFVNDGSSDGTLKLLKARLPRQSSILDLSKNCGKAEAVRRGMLHCQTLSFYQNAKWIGFWDADLATPLNELDNLLKVQSLYTTPIEAIFGSRIYKLGSQIERSFKRHLLGRIFASACAVLLKMKCYDSQCGAKLFLKEVASEIFRAPFLSKWIFDVEILLRLKNKHVVECALLSWSDVKGSKLNLFKDAVTIFSDLLKIKNHYK